MPDCGWFYQGTFAAEGELIVPQCYSCKNYRIGTLECLAYPKGIPIGILTNEIKHDHPVPGDHGIMFEPED